MIENFQQEIFSSRLLWTQIFELAPVVRTIFLIVLCPCGEVSTVVEFVDGRFIEMFWLLLAGRALLLSLLRPGLVRPGAAMAAAAAFGSFSYVGLIEGRFVTLLISSVTNRCCVLCS
jgi:hypothetical protein